MSINLICLGPNLWKYMLVRVHWKVNYFISRGALPVIFSPSHSELPEKNSKRFEQFWSSEFGPENLAKMVFFLIFRWILLFLGKILYTFTHKNIIFYFTNWMTALMIMLAQTILRYRSYQKKIQKDLSNFGLLNLDPKIGPNGLFSDIFDEFWCLKGKSFKHWPMKTLYFFYKLDDSINDHACHLFT